ncbi:MAG: peptidase M14 [Legionellales bacterium]|nr:peptidase M14 [Legionellales bacterium]|tara:strand:- start:1728 stop:2753 length:1026 start_codon:yes stop_codon:yes gene_type:complete
MKNQTLKICNETIHPGESLSLAIPLPEIFSCSPLYMPVKVVHGKQAGPCVVILAAIYGNELNGSEIINRLLNSSTMNKLKGTLIAIPVVNVFGLMTRSQLLPNDQDLDTHFPGSEKGSHASRFANLILQEILSHADYCIDLRTGALNHSDLPQVYTTKNEPDSLELAKVFNAPVITRVRPVENTLRATLAKQNIPYIVYEAGEAMRFDEHAIKIGMKGIVNLFKKLDMLSAKISDKTKETQSFITEESFWIHASTSGVNHSKVKLGQLVKKGDILSSIRDPFGASETEVIRSGYDGIIVGMNNLPLVREGEALFQLSMFTQMDEAISHFESWDYQEGLNNE